MSRKRVARFSIDAEKYALAEDGSTLTLDHGTEGIFSFAVPNFSKALATLEVCTKDLRKTLGIDQQIVDRVTVDAKSLGPVFSGNDYSLDALWRRLQGIVGVLVFVGTNGRVPSCWNGVAPRPTSARSAGLRPATTGRHPRRDNSATTMRPVWP